MAVGMESSDDEFGIVAAEPCFDKGVFQNGYLMHELAFACNDIPPLPHFFATIRMVCLEDSCMVRVSFVACRWRSWSGCACGSSETRSCNALLLASKLCLNLFPSLASGSFVFFHSGNIRSKRQRFLFLRTQLSAPRRESTWLIESLPLAT